MVEERISGYQVLLRAILHPLASTGVKDAGKVVKHLQEVFEINGAQFDISLLKNEIFKSLELKVEIVQAKKLKSMDPNGLSDPYCTLAILSSGDIDDQGDIKNNNLKNMELAMKTSIKKETLDPVWNEKFRLRVNDVFTDQLLICVWDSDDEDTTVWENVKSLERPSGIISLFRQVKHSIGKNKLEDEFIGVVAIPLKDIPQEGCDTWWDITTRLKKNSKVTGSLHLRLTLKQPKQERDETLDSELCSMEDYFSILKEMHRHAASLKEGEAEYDGILLPESKRALEMFSKQSYVTPSRGKLVHLIVLLEWNAKGNLPQASEEAILQAFFYLEEAMSKASTWELVNEECSTPLYFTDYELTKLDQVACAYVEWCCLDNGLLSEALFPIDNDVIPLLQNKLKILRKLVSLKVDQSNMIYRKELIKQLTMRLKKDVCKWLDNNVKEFSEEGRDSVLQDMTDFTMLLVELAKYCSVEQLMRLLPFNEWGFDYPFHLAQAVDERIHSNCKALMSKMDHYQNRYKNFHVNIRESSALSHTYYVTLKRLVNILKKNVSKFEKDKVENATQMKLSNFSSWFHQGFLHLLEAFKTECYLRTTRAVQLDNRSVLTSEQGDEGIQFSNSAVYVLSCFAEILTEWKQLDMEQRELHLAFLVKLTDVICDATKVYSELMEKQAKKRCERTGEKQFVIPMEVCTSINNIDHVWDYIKELPQKMTWDHIEADTELAKQTTDVLYRLLDGAQESTTFLKEKIIDNVMEEINKIAKENLKNWLKVQGQSKDADEHLSFLDKNLRILHLHTRPHIFAYALPKIWSFTLQTIPEGFQEGQRPEYAQVICKNLQVLREYLTSLGMEESCLEQEYNCLHNVLKLHSLSSVELQLHYYEELSGKVQTPVEYIGHLAFRAGYKEVTKGTIDIVVKVLNAQGLPKQDYSGLCDPFVIVELCPQVMFPNFQPEKTRILYHTLEPVFNETFEFCDIPSTVLNMNGAVIHFLVMDRDTLSSDFTGEFFVSLRSIADMTKFISVDFLPAQLVPLKQFSDVSPTFQILEKRCQWDKHAKSFMQKRQKYSRNNGEVSVNCSPKKKISFCGLFE